MWAIFLFCFFFSKPNLNFNFEWGSGDVIFAPFDNDDMVSSISDGVVDLVVVLAQMFREDLVTGTFGSVDGDKQQIGTFE